MGKIKAGLLIISSLILVLVALGYGWVKSSLPQTSGTLYLEGLSAPVDIARDTRGIPHISADDAADMYFALGFAHAQDRLWQMNVNRRIGRGELAELLGPSVVGIDTFFRTLGFRHVAEKALVNLPTDVQEELQAYANGVNAFIQQNKAALPPEFLLTGSRPVLWHPVDSLIWHKMMWLDLSGNMRQEIARARLLTVLSPDEVMSLYPTYAGDIEDPLPNLSDLYRKSPLAETALALGPEKPAGYGSNNWVVDGSKTVSGKPLLANDPHLGLTTPSIWYLTRLHNRATGKNIVGVSFPGSPYIVLGRNDKIAWGFTNTAPDSQDLFIEKLSDDGKQYYTPTGLADLIERTEVIHVKGSDDIHLIVKATRHGPIVSGIYPDSADFVDNGYAIALKWTALMETDTASSALKKLVAAESFEQFKAAGHSYFGPEQNMIYADTEGNIGYYAPALVPVRHPDNHIKGRLPSPGWDALYDWQGFIPFEELPTRYNPEGGIIATANEKIVEDDYPHFITRDWSLPYRGNRIRHLLQTTDNHSLKTFGRIHADTVSDMARDILPLLTAQLDAHGGVRNLMAGWDGNMDKDKPETLIFSVWLNNYQQLIMSDELGELYSAFSWINSTLIKSTLYWSSPEGQTPPTAYYDIRVLDQAVSLHWCDDKRTLDRKETCDRYVNRAMTETIKDLSSKYGTDPKAWRWGSEHVTHQTHRPFSQLPALRSYFELSAPISGGSHTINVAGMDTAEATRNQSTFGPSYRGIFDLSDLDKSLYVQPTGQSGNPLSPHYADMFGLWQNTEYFEIPTTSSMPENIGGLLTLKPKVPQ